MREYKNLPHPTDEPEKFSQYLRDNNEVLHEGDFWILIRNSYEEDQLVLWLKRPAEYMGEIFMFEWADLDTYFKIHKDNYWYINNRSRKSVPNRLHLHIKL